MQQYQDLALKYYDLPWMNQEQASMFYDLFVKYECKDILELGHARGKSSLLIASILEELGQGHLYTCNQIKDADLYPGWNQMIFTLLEDEKLSHRATVIKSQRSWYHDLLKLVGNQNFDFVYIDGDHTLPGVAADFVFADRLLNPGGIMLFDDIHWTANRSPAVTQHGIAVLGNTHPMMNDDELDIRPVEEFCNNIMTSQNYHIIKMDHDNSMAIYRKNY